MSAQIINQGNIYGSSRDDEFQTSCIHEAEAHELVYSDGVKAWVRQRVIDSGRFTKAANIDAAVERQLKEHHAFNTELRRRTPVDYFGIDVPAKRAGRS